MAVLFMPDIVLPKDPAGFGYWRSGHYFEHRQFIDFCRGLNPPVQVPEYDIYAWSDEPEIVQLWLNTHEQIHAALRTVANVSGIDLSLVDLGDEQEWFEWMDDHAQEHRLLRTAFSIA